MCNGEFCNVMIMKAPTNNVNSKYVMGLFHNV